MVKIAIVDDGNFSLVILKVSSIDYSFLGNRGFYPF